MSDVSSNASSAPDLVEDENEAMQNAALGELGDLELEYDKAEVEILKHQIALTAPLNARRNAITSKIPMFWPTVLDTYGEDLDAHIAPQDTALLTCVTGINVVRTDPETEPRNFSIEFSFDKNASKFFTQTSLAKKFWWRVVEGQWSGIVSEPVEIHWVKGKDITNGETDRAWKRHVAKKQQQSAENANGKGKEKQKKKGEKSNNGSGKEEKSMTIEERMGGGQPSFFTWFAWKGHGRDDPFVDDLNDEDDEEDENDENVDLFSHGDELALLICNDLYPEATKYFIEALNGENDSGSDNDSDSDDDSNILDIQEASDDDEGEDEDMNAIGLGGSSTSNNNNNQNKKGIKRVDIELSGSGSDSEAHGEPPRKKSKKNVKS